MCTKPTFITFITNVVSNILLLSPCNMTYLVVQKSLTYYPNVVLLHNMTFLVSNVVLHLKTRKDAPLQNLIELGILLNPNIERTQIQRTQMVLFAPCQLHQLSNVVLCINNLLSRQLHIFFNKHFFTSKIQRGYVTYQSICCFFHFQFLMFTIHGKTDTPICK